MIGVLFEKYRQYGFFGFAQRLSRRTIKYLAAPLRFARKVQAVRKAGIASLQDRRQGQIVIVCDRLQVRAIKIAFALKQTGWEVVLLHREKIEYDAQDCFTEIRRFRNPPDALFIAAQYRPIAYHVFSTYNFDVAALFVRHKPGCVVFDNYDVLTGTVKESVLRRYPGQAELEQLCYRNADGLCCRDLRAQHLKKQLGYQLPPLILFPEYCWPEKAFLRSSKLDGTHVVYVGSIEPDPRSSAAFVYELAQQLSDNGIHLHVYPSYATVVCKLRENMDRVLSGTARQYVHIHDTISPFEIRREISRYHYGLLISTRHVDYGDDHDTYYKHQGEYLLPAKVFDYLDAGVFTLTQNARITWFVLKHCNGGAIVHSLEDIVARCKSEHPRGMSVPRSLFLENNVNRLKQFYESVSRDSVDKARARAKHRATG